MDDSEKKKLVAEKNHFEALTKEVNKRLEPAKPDWEEKVRKYTGVAIAIATAAAAIWGFILPVNIYLKERRAALTYELNDQMIKLVTDLDSDTQAVAERSILLLSYYEENSIPILLYKLERTDLNSETMISNISETITKIYEKDKVDLSKLYRRVNKKMKKLKSVSEINDFDLYTIHHILHIIDQLPMKEKESKEYLNKLIETREDLVKIDPDSTKYSIVFKKIRQSKELKVSELASK